MENSRDLISFRKTRFIALSEVLLFTKPRRLDLTEALFQYGTIIVAGSEKFYPNKKMEVIMANLIKRNRGVSPWNDFLNVDNFFEGGLMSRWEKDFPAVNISENEKSYSIDVVAPGFKKDDFKLKVEDDVLTISAESKYERKENGKEKEYTRREYSYSSFTRSFYLPDNVKDDSIAATYEDGVLKLELPKSKAQVKAAKEIAIN